MPPSSLSTLLSAGSSPARLVTSTSSQSKGRRLPSIPKAPSGSFPRFVQTLRRQPRLRPILGQCRGRFRRSRRSPQPPGRSNQIAQAFSSNPLSVNDFVRVQQLSFDPSAFRLGAARLSAATALRIRRKHGLKRVWRNLRGVLGSTRCREAGGRRRPVSECERGLYTTRLAAEKVTGPEP